MQAKTKRYMHVAVGLGEETIQLRDTQDAKLHHCPRGNPRSPAEIGHRAGEYRAKGQKVQDWTLQAGPC